MTPDSRLKLNNFDLLRIAAALQVLVGHALAHLDLPMPAWWSFFAAFPGVPIFFVISGFLISKSYERSASLGTYARNRALRIYPALWVCIGLTVAVASIAGFSFVRPQAAAWLPAQMVGLIYTPAFLSTFGFGSYNGSLWTIPIELQFYIVLPLVYWLLPRRAARFDACLAAVVVFFTAVALVFVATAPPLVEGGYESPLQKLVRYSFAPHIYLFLAGALLQRLQAQQRRWIAGKGLHWLVAYLVFHFALPANAWTEVAGTLVLAVAVIAVAFTWPGVSHRLLRGNDLSYGVYIYHGLIINVFLLLGWRGHMALIPALAALTAAASFASWKLVEQPCLRRKSGRSAPSMPRVDVVASAGNG
jgi:peptidoglycan/LPS O-acetylase OafA/YrhL